MSDVGTILIGKIPEERTRGGVINISGEAGITIIEKSKQVIYRRLCTVGANSF
jgi:hypothetical protein